MESVRIEWTSATFPDHAPDYFRRLYGITQIAPLSIMLMLDMSAATRDFLRLFRFKLSGFVLAHYFMNVRHD